jgi:predicted amidohydrolase YtcJ
MTSTRFVGGAVRAGGGGERRDWLLVEGERIAASGTGSDPPRADRTVELEGAALLPAFCDAHVHLLATGLYAHGMDFRAECRATKILEAYAARASSNDAVLFGGNFEDPLDEPLTRLHLDRAVGDRPALLARADMHSGIVSTALLERLDLRGLQGVDRDDAGHPTGYLREAAVGAAWNRFNAGLSRDQQRAALESAIELAYSKGVTEVHEMLVIDWAGWRTLEVLLELAKNEPLGIVPYVATSEVERVVEMGIGRIGGDYFLDGSFGSHTAWLSEPYLSPPPPGSPAEGISYHDDAELRELFSAGQERGLQVGVHAIGDAAIEQALRVWEQIAERVGVAAVRALGHRIEHFECASDDHIGRAARLGLKVSIQPAFDRCWGGEDGLYAQRIGWSRARHMNRFHTMLRAGLRLGAGSDSTVTPLDPFLQMAALREHHIAGERLDALDALRLHTHDARALAAERAAAADLVIVDRDPMEAEGEELLDIRVLETWVRGVPVWPRHAAVEA